MVWQAGLSQYLVELQWYFTSWDKKNLDLSFG